jgi:hypothetical protein
MLGRYPWIIHISVPWIWILHRLDRDSPQSIHGWSMQLPIVKLVIDSTKINYNYDYKSTSSCSCGNTISNPFSLHSATAPLPFWHCNNNIWMTPGATVPSQACWLSWSTRDTRKRLYVLFLWNNASKVSIMFIGDPRYIGHTPSQHIWYFTLDHSGSSNASARSASTSFLCCTCGYS